MSQRAPAFAAQRAEGDNRSRVVVAGFSPEPAATAALRLASAAAASRGTTLTVIHQVVGSEMPERWGPQAGDRRVLDSVSQRLQADIAAVTGDRTPMHLVLTEQPVEFELQAQAADASLVVLGNHHRAWLFSRMFTSAPAVAARSFPCPVILVPASTAQISHLVAGYDGSKAAIAAARWAAAEARRCGVSGTAVRIAEHSEYPDSADWTPVVGLGRVLDMVTAYGDPAAILTEYAVPGGMVVVGRHYSGLERHSVIRSLTAHAEVPVAVIPEFWEEPGPRQ